jgi:micrococcal nuclease
MGSCISMPSVITSSSIPKDVHVGNLPSYTPKVKNPFVIKVYDGDTITVAGRIAGEQTIYKFSVRLRGIDCPEMKTKNESEKYIAIKARDFVADLCLNKYVKLENCSNDKYGRLLADVIVNGKNISTLLIENKLAVAYDGGTKHVPKNWDMFYNGSADL